MFLLRSGLSPFSLRLLKWEYFYKNKTLFVFIAKIWHKMRVNGFGMLLIEKKLRHTEHPCPKLRNVQQWWDCLLFIGSCVIFTPISFPYFVNLDVSSDWMNADERQNAETMSWIFCHRDEDLYGWFDSCTRWNCHGA